jgi:hypothetical protein
MGDPIAIAKRNIVQTDDALGVVVADTLQTTKLTVNHG